jgi:hypothetical protein
MYTDSLRVDLADMDDVRAQLPRARAILARKRSALELCQADYDSFRELVGLLAKRAGMDLEETTPSADTDGETDSTDSTRGRGDVLGAVVELVNREPRPIRARDVKQILLGEGHVLVGDAVRDALYYAANRREPPLIRSLPERGYYAPLSYRHPQDSLVPNGDTPTEASDHATTRGPYEGQGP